MAISSLTTYKKYETSSATLQTQYEKTSNIQRDVDNFTSALSKAKTVDDLFKNPRIYSFLATALNLEGEDQYPGKMRRILSEKVDDKNAVMNRLTDKRYYQAAESLQLGETGLDTLKSDDTLAGVISAYKTAKFESSIGTDNLAVRKARYFEKYASTASDNIYSILGDGILRDVVTTTLGLPQQIAIQPVETQATAVTSRMDISKLSDPKYRETFIKRYLTQYDMSNTASSGSTDWRASLFSSSSSTSGVSIVNLFA